MVDLFKLSPIKNLKSQVRYTIKTTFSHYNLNNQDNRQN